MAFTTEASKPLRIEVTGSSTISHRAERGIMHLRISSNGPDAAQVSLDVTRTSNDLQQFLRSDLCPKDPQTGNIPSTAAVTHWSMSSLRTSSHNYYPGGVFGGKAHVPEPTKSHTAHTSFEIKFQDFARLGQVATQLSGMPFVEIQSIRWELTEATKTSFATQSRKDAVADAVQKARDFAAAVGKADIRPVLISSGGNGASGFLFGRAPGVQTRSAMPNGPGAQEEGLNFEPESCDISCEVKVNFEAE
jgi:uncharacterized protein